MLAHVFSPAASPNPGDWLSSWTLFHWKKLFGRWVVDRDPALFIKDNPEHERSDLIFIKPWQIFRWKWSSISHPKSDSNRRYTASTLRLHKEMTLKGKLVKLKSSPNYCPPQRSAGSVLTLAWSISVGKLQPKFGKQLFLHFFLIVVFPFTDFLKHLLTLAQSQTRPFSVLP